MQRSVRNAALIAVVLLAVPTLVFTGGQKETRGEVAPPPKVAPAGFGGELLAAGASFPFPIYSKMGEEYNKATGVRLNYQSIGSSGGIKNIKNKVVDFGGSDAYLTDEQMKEFDAPLIQFPTVAGAIVVTYNLPGNPTLRLTGPVVSDLFLGKITKWNDRAITALNPGVELPDQQIVVAHRSDGSGTTFNFTLYLSRVSEAWKNQVGYNTSVSWPTGLGGAQNAGVAGIVKQTPGAVGYVELAYATENHLPFATMQNRAGNWITASLESTSAAANTQIPVDGRIYLGNTDAPEGWPIATLTWLIAYKEQSYGGRTLEQAKRVAAFFWWLIHDGQQYAEALQYSKLPAAAVKANEAIIRSLTYQGKPILSESM